MEMSGTSNKVFQLKKKTCRTKLYVCEHLGVWLITSCDVSNYIVQVRAINRAGKGNWSNQSLGMHLHIA